MSLYDLTKDICEDAQVRRFSCSRMKVAKYNDVLIPQKALRAHVPDFRPLPNFYSVRQQSATAYHEQHNAPITVSDHS